MARPVVNITYAKVKKILNEMEAYAKAENIKQFDTAIQIDPGTSYSHPSGVVYDINDENDQGGHSIEL